MEQITSDSRIKSGFGISTSSGVFLAYVHTYFVTLDTSSVSSIGVIPTLPHDSLQHKLELYRRKWARVVRGSG